MKTSNIAKRPNDFFPDPLGEIGTIPRPVVAMAKEYTNRHVIKEHAHSRAQLLYASSGVMSVFTQKGFWVVPPQRGVWIPANIEHRIECSGDVSMRTLYLDPAACETMPGACCVVSVSPLLRELIVCATKMPRLYEIPGPEDRLATVILDQVHALQTSPLQLVIPNDPRLVRIYQSMAKDPADERALSHWGDLVGASSRTLARLFRSETGMSFGQWRQQIRIMKALQNLGHGDSVTKVALEVGYNSPSAFIAMFKKALGKTPNEYFQKHTSAEQNNV